MRGIIIRSSEMLDRKLGFNTNLSEAIYECPPDERFGVKAVLKLQMAAFTAMGSIMGWNIATIEPIDLHREETVSKVVETTLNVGIFGPQIIGALISAAVVVEAAANIRHVGEQYQPPAVAEEV